MCIREKEAWRGHDKRSAFPWHTATWLVRSTGSELSHTDWYGTKWILVFVNSQMMWEFLLLLHSSFYLHSLQGSIWTFLLIVFIPPSVTCLCENWKFVSTPCFCSSRSNHYCSINISNVKMCQCWVQMSHILNTQSLHVLYNSLIRPYLTYCLEV